MTFPELLDFAAKRPVFDPASLAAASGTVPQSLAVTINRWHAAGKIERLCQGRYRLRPPFAEPLSAGEAIALAHQLVPDTYLSLTWALQFHGLITPARGGTESEFTSVTLGPRRSFANSGGRYSYTRLPANLWWGQQVARHEGSKFPIATAAKAALDLWQLQPGEWTPDRQAGMGWRVGKGRELLSALKSAVAKAARARLHRAFESFCQTIK